ncbi:MAG: hypothetical protein RIT16_420, partial [Actinomycetota bacterium]
LNFQVIDNGEYVRGQISNASKFHKDKLVVQVEQSGTNCARLLA